MAATRAGRVTGEVLAGASREEVVVVVLGQGALIEQLQACIVELERLLGRRSGNSSLPPSGDTASSGRGEMPGARRSGRRASAGRATSQGTPAPTWLR